MGYKVLNNAFSTLASSLSAAATSMTVNTGHGDRFPVISGSDFTFVTLEDASGNIEIVRVSARAVSSDVMTIARGQDGTVARHWAAGDIVELRIVAALLDLAISHVDDLTGAHAASSIAFTPSGNISPSSNNVQSALSNLDSNLTLLDSNITSSINAINNIVGSHIADSSGAHAASAISYTPSVGVDADDVQEAIDKLAIRESLAYAVTTGTGSAFLANPLVPITEYKDGQTFNLKFHVECENNATAKISGLNPPLDLKIHNAYGEYVNVAKGDVTLGSYPFCKVILNGTALLVESSIDINTRVGHIFDHTGYEPEPNTFEVPLVPTNISRIAYPRLLQKLIKSSVVTMTIASPGVVTWVNHLLENGSPIYLTTTGALPTGHTVNAVRYVVNKTNDNFQLSLTVGGAPIATTGIQSGIHTAHYAPWGNGDGATTFGCPYIPSDYTEIRGSAGNLGTVFVGEALVPDGIQPVTTGPVRNFTYATGSTESGYLPINITAQNGGSANLAAGIRVMKLIVYQ